MAEPNVENRTLFQGDNLPFLRGINSECIDLIATDPPFNKGRDFHATPDSLAAGGEVSGSVAMGGGCAGRNGWRRSRMMSLLHGR